MGFTISSNEYIVGEDKTFTVTLSPVVDITLIGPFVTITRNHRDKLLQLAGTVTDGPNGIFTFKILREESRFFRDEGKYFIRVHLQDSGGAKDVTGEEEEHFWVEHGPGIA